jgi:hypothetical protein
MIGFKIFKRAAVTIAGIELLHRIRKGQVALDRLGVQGQAAPAIRTAVLTARERHQLGIDEKALSRSERS